MLGSRAAAAAAQCWPAGTVQSTHWTDKLEKLKDEIGRSEKSQRVEGESCKQVRGGNEWAAQHISKSCSLLSLEGAGLTNWKNENHKCSRIGEKEIKHPQFAKPTG